MTIQQIKKEIIEAARRLYDHKLIAGAEGNISYRIDDALILITPSGVSKGFINPDEMAEITIDNQMLRGNPSAERFMHLSIYKQCPTAICVVHAHPPVATTLKVGLTSIPVAPYAPAGTQALGDALLPFLPEHQTIVLERHGAVTWGASLEDALSAMESLEKMAKAL